MEDHTNSETNMGEMGEGDVDIYESFEDMDLNDSLLRGIFAYGYEKPSVIQQKAIKPLMEGKDLIAQAQSGTGKTATFTIGMLQKIDSDKNETQAIILAHTRELASQIHKVVVNISKYMKITTNLSVGGVSVRENINQLRDNPHIVIGTPGRILDMITKKHINNESVKLLILDEADELLSTIFINQVHDIFSNLLSSIHVGLFSATMNDSFFNITNKFMRNPIKILVKNEELTLEGIRQYYVNVEQNEFKYDTLCDLYSAFSASQSIIYVNSKKMADILSNKLMNDDFTVSCIHGDMNQSLRDQIIKEFRDGESRVLITTDLLSRGIDIQQISIVINYDIPKEIENYIHRIGRSGRYGRKGVAINFITNYDSDKIKHIEKYYATEIVELPNTDIFNF
jgi:translation initiation factor 4A